MLIANYSVFLIPPFFIGTEQNVEVNCFHFPIHLQNRRNDSVHEKITRNAYTSNDFPTNTEILYTSCNLNIISLNIKIEMFDVCNL